MDNQRHRLVTRSDFDGLVCAVLLEHLGKVDEIKFVHPKDVQDGKIDFTERDITTNLPYDPRVAICFDHHHSEVHRVGEQPNHIIDPSAPSAARVVWRHFGGHDTFPAAWDEMMAAVDKGDSADFTRDEIINPQGWPLLNFLMDARTGLGRFRHFTVSNYQLMMDLISYCKDHSIDEILQLPDVKERVECYFEHEEKFKEQLQRCGKVHGKLLEMDLREEETIWPGNRFMLYALYPQCNISMSIFMGFQRQNTVFAVGKSILDRGSPVDVGSLMLAYGGGGHLAAGTCQIAHEDAERVREELIEKITAQG
ncbi:exopolyphosphatase [Halorhodospira abdelmalekii]|uniref:exopolyphosphatase n=1 Tax=Halorhodospira abdelmalekii TaxID=421629 RepID=UPI001908CD52|nr:exopolyphosphatase [Halorhodospira abdelmalekii]MBK1733798.1 exopolyphosphatase [Halorhodospira abdelmalekii]